MSEIVLVQAGQCSAASKLFGMSMRSLERGTNLYSPAATLVSSQAARSAAVPFVPHKDLEAPMGWPRNRGDDAARHIGQVALAFSPSMYSWRAASWADGVEVVSNVVSILVEYNFFLRPRRGPRENFAVIFIIFRFDSYRKGSTLF